MFTVNQDVVVDELNARFDLENNSSWNLVKDLCIPIWMKEKFKLRTVVEWISKAAYRIAGIEIAKSAGSGKGPQS
jgi:hypothetical protein